MKIKPPSSNHIDRVADWIELFVLASNKEISKSKILALLEAEDVNIAEEDIDSAIGELSRRLTLYGSVKPFKIVGNRVLPNFDWKKHPELALCLYYSTYGVGKLKKGQKADEGTKLFEHITRSCLDNFLNTNSYLFGFPASKSFKIQLDEFAALINEKRDEDPGPHDKDRDVDLVVYKKLDDTRTNSMLLFVQCAAGKNWDEKKAVAIESYRRFVSFNQKTTIPSLATTQVISISDWRNACDDYGIIVDRARLFRISCQKNIIPKKLKDEIQDWFKTKLN